MDLSSYSVDRNKYEIHLPLPPKIDPTVTMMQVLCVCVCVCVCVRVCVNYTCSLFKSTEFCIASHLRPCYAIMLIHILCFTFSALVTSRWHRWRRNPM